jgi:transposase
MTKTYTSTFKAQIVQELLRETKTISQLAAEHGIHPNVLSSWKATALKELPRLFERRDSLAAVQAAHEQQVQELSAQIGRLPTPVTWLKKKSGLDPEQA